MLGLTGGSAGVVGGERVDGVGEREADRLQLARELDALDGVARVVAVAGLRPRRWWQDADALVEADGVDGLQFVRRLALALAPELAPVGSIASVAHVHHAVEAIAPATLVGDAVERPWPCCYSRPPIAPAKKTSGSSRGDMRMLWTCPTTIQ